MARTARPLAQITAEAMKILYRELGIVDTLRFINQYTADSGDYTTQREELFAGMMLDGIVSEIRQNRKHRRAGQGKEARHKKSTSGKPIQRTTRGRQKSS